jgi:hypothetical protein
MDSKCEVRVRLILCINLPYHNMDSQRNVSGFFFVLEMYMTHFASQSHVGAALTREVIVVLYFVFLKKISHINRELNLGLLLILSVPWMTIEFYEKLNTHTTK